MSFQNLFGDMNFKSIGAMQLNPKFKEFKDLSKDDTEVDRLSVLEQQLNNQGKSYDTYIGDTSVRTYTDFVYGAVTSVKPVRLQNYRRMAQFPEVGDAIDEISDTCVNYDDNDRLVHLKVRESKIGKVQLSELEGAFDEYMSLFELDENIFDYVRTFIIEGQLAWENIVDDDDKEAGIVGVNYIPTESYDFLVNMKGEKMGISVITDNSLIGTSRLGTTMQGGLQMQTAEDFMKSKEQKEKGAQSGTENETVQFSENKGVPLPWEQVTYCDSGSYNPNKLIVYPVLERARKAFRQLSLIEDVIIIYRLARAPVRYVFNVDTGDLNRGKAEQEVYKMMRRYQTKQFYNPETGSVSNTYNPHSLLECLALDTKIPLITESYENAGIFTLQEIITKFENGEKLFTSSVDPKTNGVYLGIISYAGITRRDTKLVRLFFDNCKHIDVTYDHRFPTRNRGEVEADELTSDDELFPYIDNIKEFYGHMCKHRYVRLVRKEYVEGIHDTGTLTIDQDHIVHDYHNFATACGVYTCNSFWFPKPSGSGGTTVSTLDTPTSLWTELPDLEYFLKKLYRSLKVPFRRYKEAAVNVEKGPNITYEEYKFAKFVMRILDRMAAGFKYGYKQHLKLKGLWERFDMDDQDFVVKFTPPAMFDLYEQQKILEIKFKNYDTVTRDHPEMSKRLAMKKCLGYTDEYIDSNFKNVEEESIILASIENKTTKIKDGRNPYVREESK